MQYSTKHRQYLYGWCYGSCGHQYHAGNHQPYKNQSDKASGKGLLRWANGDRISLQFHNYKLTLSINDVVVTDRKMKVYPKLDQVDFYPAISIRQGKIEYLGFTEQ